MIDIQPANWYISYQKNRNNEYTKKKKKKYNIIRKQSYNYKIAKLKKNITPKTTIAVGGIIIVVFASAFTFNKINSNIITEVVTSEVVTNANVSTIPTLKLTTIVNTKKSENINNNISKIDYEIIEERPEFNFNIEIIDTLNKYGEMYGIDPNILVAHAMQESALKHQECLPGGNLYNGYAVGIFQIENPDGREIEAYNYVTNEVDKIDITMENASSIETNIKIGAMELQNCLKKEDGNIFLAIQAYNYNYQMVDIAVQKYALENNISVNDVRNNVDDIGWMKYIKDIHNNPSNYLSNWNNKTYGDADYISKILNYCNSETITYTYDNKEYQIDLNNYDFLNFDNNLNNYSK